MAAESGRPRLGRWLVAAGALLAAAIIAGCSLLVGDGSYAVGPAAEAGPDVVETGGGPDSTSAVDSGPRGGDSGAPTDSGGPDSTHPADGSTDAPADQASADAPLVGIAVTSGSEHACALTQDGEVWCWGSNAFGQLGDGTTTERTVPVRVVSLPQAFTVSAGKNHTCAITGSPSQGSTAMGDVYCWGDNHLGQLGDGTSAAMRLKPVPVVTQMGGSTPLPSASAVAAGGDHTCAIAIVASLEPGVYCWGDNAEGELGTGVTGGASTAPVQLPLLGDGGLAGALAVTTGTAHSCAIDGSNNLLCWGRNASGQLGDGTMVDRPGPVYVRMSVPAMFTGVSAGDKHTCAILNGSPPGVVACWGADDDGQLGLGNPDAQPSPVPTPSAVPAFAGGGVTLIAAGLDHTCAVASTQASCWGNGVEGQLGGIPVCQPMFDPTPSPIGLQMPGSTMVSLAAGYQFSCGVIAGGAAFCWGLGTTGQLGDGVLGQQCTPVPVARFP